MLPNFIKNMGHDVQIPPSPAHLSVKTGIWDRRPFPNRLAAATESVDGLHHVPARLRLFHLIQVQDATSDRPQVKAPVQGHQRVDPEGTSPGAQCPMMVAVM